MCFFYDKSEWFLNYAWCLGRMNFMHSAGAMWYNLKKSVSHGFFSISQSQKNIARFLAHLTEISQRISQKYRPNIRVFGRFHENFKPNVGKYLKKLCFDDDIQVKIWETKDIAEVFKKYGQKLVKFETWFSENLKLITLSCFKKIL